MYYLVLTNKDTGEKFTADKNNLYNYYNYLGRVNVPCTWDCFKTEKSAKSYITKNKISSVFEIEIVKIEER